MSVTIATTAVRIAGSVGRVLPGTAARDGAGRRWMGCLVASAAMLGGTVDAGDFKSLLADAGVLVFGENESGSPSPPESIPPATADSASTRAEPPTAVVAQLPDDAKLPIDRLADTPQVNPARTGRDAEAILRQLLPPRSDTSADWYASTECLHGPGEPRALSPCVPPPPCDPSQPPNPYDLVGIHGVPSCGPIYRGPCEPRSARNHHGVFAWYHHLCDRMFDHFYRPK